jgi:soluble lytic murein transglycosylase-like protein
MTLPPKVTYVVVDRHDASQPATVISPVFTPEVQFWSAQIAYWAKEYNLDPNLIATVIQIESCGDPTVGSPSGAQGLFQVMPFHFAQGEAMLDVQTNARRGLSYLAEGLSKAQGDAGLALAGYNGGHGMIDWGWARWPDQTRRYYYWAVGIYQEATSGQAASLRLAEWLAAGGSLLCERAAVVQQTLPSS